MIGHTRNGARGAGTRAPSATRFENVHTFRAEVKFHRAPIRRFGISLEFFSEGQLLEPVCPRSTGSIGIQIKLLPWNERTKKYPPSLQPSWLNWV
jgi:hypothetical protein